jgi:hypothetical protein
MGLTFQSIYAVHKTKPYEKLRVSGTIAIAKKSKQKLPVLLLNTNYFICNFTFKN